MTSDVDQTPAAEATPEARFAPGLLGEDGLAGVPFGEDVGSILEKLTAVLGEPEEDSGWTEAQNAGMGFCPGKTARVVRWGRLRIELSDGETDVRPGSSRHFFVYQFAEWFSPTEMALTMEKGVGIGTSLGDLQEAYGSRVTVVENEPILSPGCQIEHGRNWDSFGALTSTDETGRVQSIHDGGSVVWRMSRACR